MKRKLCILVLVCLVLGGGRTWAWTEPNRLTEQEKNAGWALLFDGKTTAGSRKYNGTGMPQSWKVVDGSLVSDYGHPIEFRSIKFDR